MLAIAYAVTGGAYDFYAFDSAGQVYNGSAWVAWDDSDFNDYRIPATESGASGRFVATLPDDTARYAMRASGVDLAGSYLVWEEAVDAGGGGGLTPDQATQLAEMHAKAMLIGTDGALAEIVSPLGAGGDITLYSGVDYVDTAAGPLVIPVPAAVQSRAPATEQAIYFQARRRRTGTDYFDVTGTVIEDPDAPGSKAVSIPIPRGSIDANLPLDDHWYYFVGDRPASLQDAFMTGSLKICPGPIPPG